MLKQFAWQLYSLPALHRLLPMSVADRLIRQRTQRALASGLGDLARLHMEFLLGESSRAGDVDELAAEHVYETHKRAELRWRPWLTSRMPIDGLDRPAVQRHRKAGLVLQFMHQGAYEGVGISLASWRGGLYVPVDDVVLQPDAGPVLRRHRQTYGMTGNILVPSSGSYARLLAQLRGGDAVIVASDMPGRSEVSFLGRRIRVASGAARLAVEAGVPVIPITVHRQGFMQRAVMQDPLYPSDFRSDVNELLQAIWDAQASAVLEWPAGLDAPLTRWVAADPHVQQEFTERHDRLVESARRAGLVAEA